MKFGKTYREYFRAQQDGRRRTGKSALPAVDFKRLKKLLKSCSTQSGYSDDGHGRRCHACDDTFFHSLRQEMSAVVRCFNRRARNLLKLQLGSGFRRCFVWMGDKIQKHDYNSLTQEGKDIVTYAIVSSIAMKKILKKYDKIHQSKRGQAFRSQALSMNIEILQSPWLCELMAFHINTRVGNRKPWATDGVLEGCSLSMEDEKPVLSCSLFDSLKLSTDLTCSICLDTVFDTVALSCGHIFCYMCACRSALVSIVNGLKSADRKAKCPLCRQGGVFHGAIHLRQLNVLLSRNCQEYWQQRRQTERVDRVRLAKEHWDRQCRALVGV